MAAVGASATVAGMPSRELWLGFLLAAVGLILIPGPNTFFLLARGLQDGRRAALRAAVGVELSTLVLATATAIGLAHLIAASEAAFQVTKWGGAAYLCFLGWQALTAPATDPALDAVTDGEPAQIKARTRRRRHRGWPSQVLAGFTVGVSNPKVILFFLAFLPQFVDPARPAASQLLVLGVTLACVGMAYGILLSFTAGRIRSWLGNRPGRMRALHRSSAGFYFGLAGWAVFTGQRAP